MEEQQMTGQPNEVQVIKNSLDLIKEGPNILIANRDKKMRALVVGNNLLSLIHGGGMTPELDERAKKFLVNAAAAKKKMNEDRSAVTQIMDKLKSMYTEVENDLDITKPGTVPYKVQLERNAYVKKVAEEQEEKRKAAELLQKQAQARIDVRATAEQKLAEFFNNLLLEKKQKVTNAFNNLELKGFADGAATIRMYQPEYKPEMHNKFSPMIPAVISQEEVHDIVTEVRESKWIEYSERYVREMTEHKNDIVDKIPSKQEELKRAKELADQAEADRIAAANAKNAAERKAAELRQQQAQEQQRIQEQQRKDREAAEQLRLQEEAAEAQKLAIQESQIKQQGETAMAMFEKEAAVAESSVAPETKKSWEIVVQHSVGFTQIFAVWFEKIGKDLPLDKLGNTKLDQMKAWAEKECTKNGFRIESKFLEYREEFKAVNRKAKES